MYFHSWGWDGGNSSAIFQLGYALEIITEDRGFRVMARFCHSSRGQHN